MPSKSTFANHQNIHKIFLVGLNPKFKFPELLEFLKTRFPSVISCTSKSSNKSGKIKTSIATVSLLCEEEARELIQLGSLEFKGRTIHSKPYLTGKELERFKESVNRRRVFLHNINPRVKNEALREVLSKYGEIEDAFVIKKKKAKSSKVHRNIGYVIFQEEAEAEKFRAKQKIKTELGVIKIKEFKVENKIYSSKASIGSFEGEKPNKKEAYAYGSSLDRVRTSCDFSAKDRFSYNRTHAMPLNLKFAGLKEVLKSGFFQGMLHHQRENIRLNKKIKW